MNEHTFTLNYMTELFRIYNTIIWSKLYYLFFEQFNKVI